MAGFAGVGTGNQSVAFDQGSALLFVEDMTALAAKSLFQHDVGHGMVEAFASLSGVKDFLGFVVILMAGIAVGNGIDILDDLVLDFQMALIAFDLILVNMLGMHEVCVLIFVQSLPFSVAFVAVFPGDFAISDNGIAVAFVTGKSIGENQGVIVTRGLGTNEGFLRMTVTAVIDLGILIAFFEMTDKTGTLRDRYMFALNDLRMTARALELFSSFEVFEMDRVVECDIVEHHLAFQESFFMTAFPEAAVVADLGPWFGFDVEFRPVAADHDQPFDLFSQFGAYPPARRVMTNTALDFLMRGCFPAFEKGFHVMAGSAEILMGCEFYRT
jgi:hypothetical protein